MKIAFAASEVWPFIKTGGLGDVAEALPRALSEYMGNEVSVFLPYYRSIKQNAGIATERVAVFETNLGWRRAYTGLDRLKSKRRKLRIYFIDNEQYFGRDRIYGEPDDGERFAFFSKAVLESLTVLSYAPDIIHSNDWQTALIPTLLHAFYEDTLGGAKTVFTIHNIEYQGWAHTDFLSDVLALPGGYESRFDFHGSVNFMKSAVLGSDAVTTVSRTYAKEICYPYFAHGLEDIMREHAFKTVGIVNGINTELNSPKSDKFLIKNYDEKSFDDGKRECKAALQAELGLPVREDVALIGIVSRLVGHKGFDIIYEAIDEMMELDVQLVILGTGDPFYEKRLSEAASRYPDRLSLNLGFSGAVASRVYAASDIYLMPSRSEPCGLSQLLAMRYGAVPVVHETGGLKDTVTPFNVESGEGLGFTFGSFTAEDMMCALYRALDVYRTKGPLWRRVVYNGMSADFSWDKPAREYMALYRKLKNS